MATKTSAAVGTAAQFMPQPDSDYQARLQGVQGVRGQAPKDTQEGMIADSLGGALSAYLDFNEKQDKRFETQMAEAAENMVNAATREDVERLTSVEIAQKYGYGTLVDNPYFEAMVSKMRGVRLMSTADAEYNQLYGDNQAESMEAEQQRYEEFMNQKRDDYLQSSPSMNFTAFDAGFYSKKSESLARLMSNRSERDVADKLTEVVATTSAQINTLIYDAAKYDVAGIKTQLQSLVNPYRLSNAQPAARYKLVEDAMIGLADTGLFSAEQLQDIADSVMVDTRLDGTEVPISSLVGMQTISDLANDAHKNHVTGKALDVVRTYKTHHNMDSYWAAIRKKYDSGDPKQIAEARFMEGIAPMVQTEQNKYRTQQQKLLKAKADKRKAQIKQQDYDQLCLENFKLAEDGNHDATDVFGNTEGLIYDNEGKQVPTEVVLAAWQRRFQQVQNDTNLTEEERLDKLANLSTHKSVSSFIGTYRERLLGTMMQQDVGQLRQGLVEGTYMNLFNMYRANPSAFNRAYGADMTHAMQRISYRAMNSGQADSNSVALGFADWVDYMKMPEDQRRGVSNQWSSGLSTYQQQHGSSPQIQGIRNLDTGEEEDISIEQFYDTGDVYAENVQWYLAMGFSFNDAVTNANADFKNNWMVKAGGLLPKTLFYDVYPTADSQSNADAIGNEAINGLIAKYFQRPYLRRGTPSDVALTYHPSTGILVLYDTYTGKQQPISQSELYNQMAYVATLDRSQDINTTSVQRTAPNSPNAYAGDWWSNPNYRRFT